MVGEGENINAATKTGQLHPADWPGGYDLAIGHYTALTYHHRQEETAHVCPYCGVKLTSWPDQKEINRIIYVEPDGSCILEQVDGELFMLCSCPTCHSEFTHPRG